MTFQEIHDSAKVVILSYKIQINKKEQELLELQRKLEEQEGMLEDALKWINSKW